MAEAREFTDKALNEKCTKVIRKYLLKYSHSCTPLISLHLDYIPQKDGSSKTNQCTKMCGSNDLSSCDIYNKKSLSFATFALCNQKVGLFAVNEYENALNFKGFSEREPHFGLISARLKSRK